jgi:hypothetical protein
LWEAFLNGGEGKGKMSEIVYKHKLGTDFIVKSENGIGIEYVVTKCSASFSCTCPLFVFRKQVYKHIKKVKMWIAGENQKNKLF